MLTLSIHDFAGPFLRELKTGIPREAVTVMRSVANELNKRYAAYARSGPFGPFAPVTQALRKKYKSGYGQWISRFSRYQVDPATLTARVGVLSKGDLAGMGQVRFVPISDSFSRSAALHAQGYTTYVTKSRQRSIAKALRRVYSGSGKWSDVNPLVNSIMPRLGPHFVKPRPVAGPVFSANRQWIGDAFNKLYDIKRAGDRYSKDWARED